MWLDIHKSRPLPAGNVTLVATVPHYRSRVSLSRAQLQSFRNASVSDLVGPRLKLLFVGINPGLWTAVTPTHFAHPGNRSYPALRLAGIVDRDRSGPMTEHDRAYCGAGIGITNLVNRATARADELSPPSCGRRVPGWRNSSRWTTADE